MKQRDHAPNVESAVEAFCLHASTALGPNLQSIVLYGSLARGRFVPDRSDANLALVLREATSDALRSLHESFRVARQSARFEVMVLEDRELSASAESFALTILEIREGGVLRFGRDCLSAIEIPTEWIRLRCEQELRNRLLRLWRGLVLAGDDVLELRRLLWMKRGSIAVDLKWFLRLGGETVPPEATDDAILSIALTRLGFSAEESKLLQEEVLRDSDLSQWWAAAALLLRVLERSLQRITANHTP